ncbi:MAG: hypothetical protein Q7T30_04255 [Planctomycetota bacterium]|nr:hypothetical protein [Planctomycetota bacterium]
MKTVITVSLLLTIAACAGPRYVERTAPVPVITPPALLPRRADPAPLPAPDDAATRAWLDQEIERNRYVPPPPPVEVVERIVERPVYVSAPGGYYEPYAYEPYAYRPYYHYGSYQRHYDHPTTFPLHTALGAGIGAIVGHQSGHRGRGAWIGGGLGLLMDLGSHW